MGNELANQNYNFWLAHLYNNQVVVILRLGLINIWLIDERNISRLDSFRFGLAILIFYFSYDLFPPVGLSNANEHLSVYLLFSFCC